MIYMTVICNLLPLLPILPPPLPPPQSTTGCGHNDWHITIEVLNTRKKNRSEQTVQTQIRLLLQSALLEEQSDQGL